MVVSPSLVQASTPQWTEPSALVVSLSRAAFRIQIMDSPEILRYNSIAHHTDNSKTSPRRQRSMRERPSLPALKRPGAAQE
jgi:hypothetical protein